MERFARLITFDKRGLGFGPLPRRRNLEDRMDDIRAVYTPAGSHGLCGGVGRRAFGDVISRRPFLTG